MCDSRIFSHNEAPIGSLSRLVIDDKIQDLGSIGLSAEDRIALFELIALPESLLGSKRIEDHFAEPFFKTYFWYMWRTRFAFQPWHSLAEFKRYCLRCIQEFHRIRTVSGTALSISRHDTDPVRVIDLLKDMPHALFGAIPYPTIDDLALIKQQAIERWENEGGEIPQSIGDSTV